MTDAMTDTPFDAGPLDAHLPVPLAVPRAPVVDGPQRDLLCALGYVYLACGEPQRALALLRIVERDAPDDVELLRALAYGHIAAEEGGAALDLLDRLDALDLDPDSRTPLLLMRSHALRLTGRWTEARHCFARFVTARNDGPHDGPQDGPLTEIAP
jgi:tetratricopeptide (TPR) repeat protein